MKIQNTTHFNDCCIRTSVRQHFPKSYFKNGKYLILVIRKTVIDVYVYVPAYYNNCIDYKNEVYLALSSDSGTDVLYYKV